MPNAENDRRGIGLRYCSETWQGYRCDKRYDHSEAHRNEALGVTWSRILPPAKTD